MARPPASPPEDLDDVGEEYDGPVLHTGVLADDDELDSADGDGEQAAPSPVDAAALEERVGAPLIAIVGRPNVGKSRLFNRMTGTRFAIVEDMPGVTRDRQYGEGTYDGRPFQVVDTGGFEPDSEDVLLAQMRQQARLAMEEADLIIFVMDGQSGILPADRDIARLLRQTDKPVFCVVNKIDGPKHEIHVPEFYELGVDALYPISAEHGRDYDVLMDAIEPHLPDPEAAADPPDLVKLAVLGKPNAGKSTLVNALLGEDRLLTSDIPGTTRDAINTYLERDDKRYLMIDTAGVRRKRSIHEQVERYAVVQAFKAIDRAEVVIYVIDATAGVTSQDQRICGMVHDKGRGLVLVLNKWDLVAKDHTTAGEYVKALREEMHFARHAPVVTTSALTGQRIHRLLPLVHDVHAQFRRRISTSKLNDAVEALVRRNPPKTRMNRRLRVFYASQVATRPPTIMFAVNDPELVHFSYERYLQNGLRREFGFAGVPLKFFFRGRKKSEIAEG